MKSKLLRNAALAVVAVFVGIQFVPVDRSNPVVTGDVGAEPEVDALLRAACYDCHSNETKWPAYAYVAPVSWLLNHHVKEGREELNFSAWQSLPTDRKDRKLEEIVELVEKHEMPLASYVRMHREARLSEESRGRIVEWARRMRQSLDQPETPSESGAAPDVAEAF